MEQRSLENEDYKVGTDVHAVGQAAGRSKTGKGAGKRAGPGEDEISLLDITLVFLRQRWTILACILAFPFLVVAVNLFSQRRWTASTSFMPQTGMDVTSAGLRSLAGQFGFDIGSVDAGQSPEFYAQLVASREILGQLAADTFAVSGARGRLPDGTNRGKLADILNLERQHPDLQTDAVVRWLQHRAVKVSTDRETGVVSVSATTRWPALSTQIAATIVELVNDFNLDTRKSQASAERQFVEERMKAAGADLRAAENELQDFLQKNRAFQNSPELVFQHDRLQRQVGMRQQLYTSLVQSYEQARIAEVRNTPVITVVEDVQKPARPDSRHLFLKVFLGVVVGAFVGIIIGVVREYIRQQRENGSQELREVSVLWRQTKEDFGNFVRRFGRNG